MKQGLISLSNLPQPIQQKIIQQYGSLNDYHQKVYELCEELRMLHRNNNVKQVQKKIDDIEMQRLELKEALVNFGLNEEKAHSVWI